MDTQDKLIKAMVEESPFKYHGYAYGALCTFKSIEDVKAAEEEIAKSVNLDNVPDELILDF